MYYLKMWCSNKPSIVLYFGYFREKSDALTEYKVKMAFERSRTTPIVGNEEVKRVCEPDSWEYKIVEGDIPSNKKALSPYVSIKRATEDNQGFLHHG